MTSKKKRTSRALRQTNASGRDSTAWLGRHGAWIAVFAVLAFVALVRWRVADVPLERDEGEYAYAGQLILQGIPPYRLAYNMKFPGTYYAYSLMLVLFGQTPWGIHVGLLLVNAATVLVLFVIGRRLLGDRAGAIGAAAFAFLSLDRWIMGVFAHATHFVLLPSLAGFLVLLGAVHSRRSSRFVAAGALLGASVLMKQHAVLLLPLGIGFGLWSETWRAPLDLRGMAIRSSLLVAGAAMPLAVLCAVFAAQGVLGRFWFWTFQYAKEYVSEVPLSDAWPLLVDGWNTITQANLPIWILAALGVAMLWLVRWTEEARVFLAGLLAASFLAICPGFYFREHYFILLLPAAGLFAGVAVVSIERLLGRVCSGAAARAIGVAVFTGVLATYVVHERDYLFSMTPRDLSRARYGSNPFVEGAEIARYIAEQTAPEDRIAVLGSEPEIYFYANRKSATGYIYTYPLMEPQQYASRMQDEMIQEVETAHPKYVVLVGVGMSWLRRPESDPKIATWTGRYTHTCYDLVGIADIHPINETTWRWDGDVAGYQPRSQNLVYTFKRKADAPCVAGR